jgi:hypothetical protein
MGEDVAHQAPPWVGSRSPDGWDQIPLWAVGWVLHQPPWSFGFDSKREEPGKTGRHPVLKYRVPHGSHPPREQLYNRYCSNKHTHTLHAEGTIYQESSKNRVVRRTRVPGARYCIQQELNLAVHEMVRVGGGKRHTVLPSL